VTGEAQSGSFSIIATTMPAIAQITKIVDCR